jgi:DNA-binding SARP family transcriptional activator
VAENFGALVTQECDDHDPATVVHLVGMPHVTVRREHIEIPESSARLLAFVALHRGGVQRRSTAGILWPTGGDARAAGNLRTALWRLNATLPELVLADKNTLLLASDAAVDVELISAWAIRLITGDVCVGDLGVVPGDLETLDLLPGWYDDWALIERERFRHRVLHGLEALSRAQRRQGQWAQAVESALTVVSADPLRESAQRVLIEAHLAEGNLAEARRSFEVYRELLRRELGVEPAHDLASLVRVAPDHRPPRPRPVPALQHR